MRSQLRFRQGAKKDSNCSLIRLRPDPIRRHRHPRADLGIAPPDRLSQAAGGNRKCRDLGWIPAGIVAMGDVLEQLYRPMVDEDMVRKDISFAEMASWAYITRWNR